MQPRDLTTGQLRLGKWPGTDPATDPVALHKQQLHVTKAQLGHLYRQWVSGNFHDNSTNSSSETTALGNEQFNIMFSLFHSLLDTFKEVEKQHKVFQMKMKRGRRMMWMTTNNNYNNKDTYNSNNNTHTNSDID